MTLRILIADDHGVLRAGLRALLSAEPDIEVVGEASDGQAVLEIAQNLQPDVILMDLSMPKCGGIEATSRIKEMLPGASVLILTMHEEESLLREAIQCGAAGYILKRAVETELIDAIRAVARGELYIHPGMTRALFPDSTAKTTDVKLPIPTLTRREYQVLGLIAQGYSNRQTAAKLTISVRTVESHRANLMNKLDLHSRVELVRFATQHGLLEDWENDKPAQGK